MVPDRRHCALFRKYKSINGLTYPSATARLSRVGSQKKQKTKNFKQMEQPLTRRDPPGLVMVHTAMSPGDTTCVSRNA
jgi:hypothetical protein